MAPLTWKQGLIALIQALADATKVDMMRVALGTPGSHVDLGPGQQYETGQSWINLPQIWDLVMEGITSYFKPTINGVSTSPYDVLAADDIIEVAANGVTLVLPADGRTVGRPLFVKNGDVSSTVVDGNGNTIDGSLVVVALPDPWDWLGLYWNGSGWMVWARS